METQTTRWTSRIGNHEVISAAAKYYNLDFTEDELQAIGTDLATGNFTFGEARRFFVDKTDGASRPLVNLAAKDKVAMRAMLSVIQPELNTIFSPFCYSRVGAGTLYALATLHVDLLDFQPGSVVIGDFTDYYGQIDRDVLMGSLQQRFGTDPFLIDLLFEVLYIHVVDDAGNDARRPSGIEQGLPLSPLLSNLYLATNFDAWVHDSGVEAWGRYNDDFYALPKTSGEHYSKDLRKHLKSVSLPMKEAKVQMSDGFSAAAIQALDPGQRNYATAIEWLKTRFVPHRMVSGRPNVVVEKVKTAHDDSGEMDEEHVDDLTEAKANTGVA